MAAALPQAALQELVRRAVDVASVAAGWISYQPSPSGTNGIGAPGPIRGAVHTMPRKVVGAPHGSAAVARYSNRSR